MTFKIVLTVDWVLFVFNYFFNYYYLLKQNIIELRYWPFISSQSWPFVINLYWSQHENKYRLNGFKTSVRLVNWVYALCTQLSVTQLHTEVVLKRSSSFSQVNHLLLWWSSSKVMAEEVMCQRDSGRARFNTITFIELMWNDSSCKTNTTGNFKGSVQLYLQYWPCSESPRRTEFQRF